MRFLRWLKTVVAAVTILSVMLTAVAAPPPATPEARTRGRLRGDSGELDRTLYTITDVGKYAALDAQALATTMHPEELKYVRYIPIYNHPKAQRHTKWGVVSALLNGFSHRPTIVQPALGGPDLILIRVNLFDYGISPEAWDRLGKHDPYFHLFLDKEVDEVREVTEKQAYKTGRYYGNGDPEWAYRDVKKKVTERVKVKKQVPNPLVNIQDQAVLTMLLHTDFPILRGDWFATNVTLEPFYSDFLGIKTLDQLKDAGAFDRRSDITETRGTIVNSGSDGLCPRVANNNRILSRRQTIFGGWWETFDFKTSIGVQNVINNFFNKKRDAAEYIVRAPNGMQWYLITDGNDKALAAGAIDIVVDSTAKDAQVRNGRSCIWCHGKGINPFKSQFQQQVGSRPDQADLLFYDKDPRRALILRQQAQDIFGLPNFDEIVTNDNAQFDRAVKAASGMAAEEYAGEFRSLWEGYFDDLVDSTKACYELGLSPEELQTILGLRFAGRSNGVLINALLKPKIGIRRDQWEESFFEATLLSTLKGRFIRVPVGPPPRENTTAP